MTWALHPTVDKVRVESARLTYLRDRWEMCERWGWESQNDKIDVEQQIARLEGRL